MFPGLISLCAILFRCMKIKPKIESLKIGTNSRKCIDYIAPLIIVDRSVSPFSIKRFIIKGYSSDGPFCYTNISSRGIRGTYFGKSKWKEVSIKTLAKSSKLS
jgi:hypothetical protein